jgi:transcriptional/translational regulatory protein YebC/TACO1
LIFDKHGGQVAGANAVGWMFTKKGIINIEKSKVSEEKLMDIALEAGADDVVSSEDGYEVTTTLADYETVRKALLAAKIELAQADLVMIPAQTVSVAGENAEKLHKITDGLEANDDVQNVYTNADIQDEAAV